MSDLRTWWPIEGRDELRDELEAAYADPARGYHDTLHLTEVFARLDELAPSVPYERDPVLLAAWFHDAVYDGRPDAEERSAQWASSALAGHDNSRVGEARIPSRRAHAVDHQLSRRSRCRHDKTAGAHAKRKHAFVLAVDLRLMHQA